VDKYVVISEFIDREGEKPKNILKGGAFVPHSVKQEEKYLRAGCLRPFHKGEVDPDDLKKRLDKEAAAKAKKAEDSKTDDDNDDPVAPHILEGAAHWFDVIGDDGEAINEKKLRKAEAEELLEEYLAELEDNID